MWIWCGFHSNMKMVYRWNLITYAVIIFLEFFVIDGKFYIYITCFCVSFSFFTRFNSLWKLKNPFFDSFEFFMETDYVWNHWFFGILSTYVSLTYIIHSYEQFVFHLFEFYIEIKYIWMYQWASAVMLSRMITYGDNKFLWVEVK